MYLKTKEKLPHHSNYQGIITLIFLLIYLGTMNSCAQEQALTATPQFEYKTSDYTGIDFINHIDENVDRSIGIYDYFYNGGGVACGDFDNDGLVDIFFAGNDSSNKIYQNKGGLKFEDKSAGANIESDRWSTGVCLVDINNDGLTDIYVSNSGPYNDPEKTRNQLYINKGDFIFEEQAAMYGIDDNSRSNQATFFDFDNDGDLDLWVLNHSLRSYGRSVRQWYNGRAKLPSAELSRDCNTLYENQNGKFVDISKNAKIERPGFGLGISIKDFDQDGLLDVFVANDYFIPDYLYLNNGDKTFTEQIKQKFNHVSYYSMGCDAADINNDGLTDLVVADMTPGDHVRNKTLMASMNTTRFETLTERLKYIPQYMFNGMYINHANGSMSDIAHYAGVSSTDWSWAPLLADFDNDGLKDLFVTNGFYRDTRDNDWLNELKDIQQSKGAAYTMDDYYTQLKKANQAPISNMIFKNKDGLSFDEVTKEWNTEKPSFSNGAAYADFDNDGDLDIVVNNLMEAAYLIENHADKNSHNYIQFQIGSNDQRTEILHATICVYHTSNKQCVDYNFTRGYQSYMHELAHIGLGGLTAIDSVVVTNTQGLTYKLLNPAINKKHILTDLNFQQTNEEAIESTPFADVTNILLPIGIEHLENKFNEYEKEVLLPHTQARLGPTLAVADVNGDGLEDFFLGGAHQQTARLFIQSGNGSFSENETPFNADLDFEDVGSLFFDIDNDGDQDLYIASGGGGDIESRSQFLQDRLYINDGRGNFKSDQTKIPKINSSTKAIVSFDWDKDGDLDLFVGGRTMPGKYPLSPASYFLENDNGTLKDISFRLLEDGNELGMITDAVAIDLNGDNQLELILVGEWMRITVLEFKAGVLSVMDLPELANTQGWWQSITAFDYDNDGDQDLIAGNIGLNNKFHPSIEKPLHIYANDFDETGTIDIVLSKYYNENLVPVRGKECSTEQMPFISEKFKTYNAFANANLIDILGKDKIENSVHLEASMFESVLLINEGGRFNIEKLPASAQLFPVNSVVVKDFDENGKPDLLLGGNLFDTEVETTQYDAGRGVILTNNFPGQFTSLSTTKIGLAISQNIRCIRSISLTDQKIPGLVLGNNNGPVQLFLYSNEKI